MPYRAMLNNPSKMLDLDPHADQKLKFFVVHRLVFGSWWWWWW